MLLFQTKKIPSLILKKRPLLKKFGIFPTRVFQNTKIYPLLPNPTHKPSEKESARITLLTPKPRTETAMRTELIMWPDQTDTAQKEDSHRVDPVETRTSAVSLGPLREAQTEILVRLKDLRSRLQNPVRPVNTPEGNTCLLYTSPSPRD